MSLELACELAKRFEGLHKVVTRTPAVTIAPYVCPAGYWTIGYGHLCDANQTPIDESQAVTWLEQDLNQAATWAARHSPHLIAAEPKLAAITDFIFNLGPGRYQTSTLKRRVNNRDWQGAATELRRWVYGGGRKLPGLVIRREAEAKLILQ